MLTQVIQSVKDEVWTLRAIDTKDYANDAIHCIIGLYLENRKFSSISEYEEVFQEYMGTPLKELPGGLRIILAPVFNLYLMRKD